MDDIVFVGVAVGVAAILSILYFAPCGDFSCYFSDCGECSEAGIGSLVGQYETSFGVQEEEAMQWNSPYEGYGSSPAVRLLLIFGPLLVIAGIVLIMIFFTSIGRRVLGLGMIGLSIILLILSFLLFPLSGTLRTISVVVFLAGIALFIFG